MTVVLMLTLSLLRFAVNSYPSFNLHTVSEEQISEVSSLDLLSGVHVMRVTHCVHFEN